MVSKASEDLPQPDSPVNTTRWSRGISTSMFLRLCSRAPRIAITRASGRRGRLLSNRSFMDRRNVVRTGRLRQPRNGMMPSALWMAVGRAVSGLLLDLLDLRDPCPSAPATFAADAVFSLSPLAGLGL